LRSEFETWESYFYPPPDNDTLRNLFEERDPAVLHRLEHVEAAERYRELSSGKVAIERTYDGPHLRAIHRHLFGDVYEWAGEYRAVNLRKGMGRDFADVSTGEIDRYLVEARRLVTTTVWSDLDRASFIQRAADVFAHVNQAHPFREGNGRASKLFMEHVAELSRFTLDYSRVTPDEWNQGSMLSAPDLYSFEPVPGSLLPVFEAITCDRL